MSNLTSRTLVILVTACAALVAPAAAQPSAAKPSLLQPPASWSEYYSGGPMRAGDTVTLPDGRKGVVVGDFRQIPNGTASRDNPGHYRYSVMVPTVPPKDATRDCPEFGLSIVTVEMVGGRMQVGPEKPTGDMTKEYEQRLRDYRARVLAAHKDGVAIQAKANAMLEKWNKRNDRSVKKFTTAEGYTALAFDMALAGMADKAKGLLKTTDDLDRIFKEALIDAAKEKLSGDLPLNAPGPDSNTAAAAELTKGNIKALISAKMKDPHIARLPDNTRAEILSKVLVTFGAMSLENGGDDLMETAFEAAADVAVDVGLSRYPIAGPLAKEALELTKQLRGYLMTLDKLAQADASFTTALNAFNDSYGARQSLELMRAHRKDMLKKASDALYAEDPSLEAWLVDTVAERVDARERALRRFMARTPKGALNGPPAPEDAKDPKVFLLDPNEALAMDAFLMPGYIENAGREEALAVYDTLDLGSRNYAPVRRGGYSRYDGWGDRLDRDLQDPLGGLRTIFKGTPLFRQPPTLRLELLPPEPPKPKLDERKALERDCRLKRMAQAERDVPRIGPQVRRILMLRAAIADIPDRGPGGVNSGRFDDTRIPSVYLRSRSGASKALPAGLLRD